MITDTFKDCLPHLKNNLQSRFYSKNPSLNVNKLPDGWINLCIKLFDDLSKIDKSFTLTMAQEKYGTLFFAASARIMGKHTRESFEKLIYNAIKSAETTCMICGESNGYISFKNGINPEIHCDDCLPSLNTRIPKY